MTAEQSSEKWLVRTEKNQILGPFPRELVRQMVLDGKLGLQDEVCMGNSYWIYLHETEELRQQLGVVAPRIRSDDEDTETETEILTVKWGTGGNEAPLEKWRHRGRLPLILLVI